jgi:hypothetical protein
MEKASDRKLIERAFNRATELDYFVARDLAFYCSLNQIDEVALSRVLKATPEDVHRLGLCRRPESNPLVFRSQVETIARHTGVDPQRLAELFRETEAARALGTLSITSSDTSAVGTLMAARDRTANTKTRRRTKSKHETRGPKRK